MPVSNPLAIAALVRENRHRFGLAQLQFALKKPGLLLDAPSMENLSASGVAGDDE
jgi:hypothetical protein